MRVCHGLAGEALEVDDQELQWRRPLDIVRQLARDHWETDAGDLIVLAAGGLLLGAGGAQEEPGAAGDVFLFLRSDLAPEADGMPELLVPDPNNLRGLDDDAGRVQVDEDGAGDPAFEVFLGNIAEARRRLEEVRPTAALAARCEARVDVQRLAVRAVLDNLTHHRSTCGRSMTLFLQKYERVQERFERSLGQVDVSLAALGAIALHPALRAPGRETLGDAVPRDRIGRFAAGLQAERAQLAQRLEKLRRQDSQARGLCEQVAEKVRRLIEDDAVLAAARDLRGEHDRAEREMLGALRCMVPSPGAAPISVLEDEKRSTALLADLSKVCRDVALLKLSGLQLCWDRQRAAVLQRLREVAFVQAKVRNVERQAALLEEEINVQRNHSQQLSHLQKMPRAYHGAVAEIARRRQFRARYVQQAEQAKSALSRMVDEENVRRRTFVHRYGCHLPAELVPGLGALVPPTAITVPEFDLQLPAIDAGSLREALDSPAGAAASVAGSDLGPEAAGSRQSDADGRRGADGAAAGPCGSGARDRCSSSSTSSSLRSPWPPPGSSSARGAGSGSSGAGAAGSQSQSESRGGGVQVSASIQRSGAGEDLWGSAATRRIEDLEARNRELEAKVAHLSRELERQRGAPAAAAEDVPAAAGCDAAAQLEDSAEEDSMEEEGVEEAGEDDRAAP